MVDIAQQEAGDGKKLMSSERTVHLIDAAQHF
jgi:hypothetical protein